MYEERFSLNNKKYQIFWNHTDSQRILYPFVNLKMLQVFGQIPDDEKRK